MAMSRVALLISSYRLRAFALQVHDQQRRKDHANEQCQLIPLIYLEPPWFMYHMSLKKPPIVETLHLHLRIFLSVG